MASSTFHLLLAAIQPRNLTSHFSTALQPWTPVDMGRAAAGWRVGSHTERCLEYLRVMQRKSRYNQSGPYVRFESFCFSSA